MHSFSAGARTLLGLVEEGLHAAQQHDAARHRGRQVARLGARQHGPERVGRVGGAP